MGYTIYPLSEYAVSVDFGGAIDQGTLQRLTDFNSLLNAQPFEGLRTTVPAYTTLTVFFDPSSVIASPLLAGLSAYERVFTYLRQLATRSADVPLRPQRTVTIPICYGGAYGPDLDALAAHHGISAADVIELHSTVSYHVHFVGFTPGFAYLGGMTAQLAMPRRGEPRSRVPAGSVGIAGTQTGIYPLATPGGWQLIGRTPLRLFDPNNTSPTLLCAGDRVVFLPIAHNEFTNYPIADATTRP